MKLSLRQKITLLILSAVSVTGLLYSSISIVRVQNSMRNEMIEEKKALTEFLATTFEVAEAKAGIAYRYKLIEELVEYEDVVYIKMVKPSGEIYLSSDRDEIGKFIKDDAIFTEATLVRDDVYNGKSIKVAIAPSATGYTVWLGFSLEKLKALVAKAIATNVLIFIALAGTVVGISHFFSKKMLRPIKALMIGVESIRKGNLGYHIEVESKDEIGDLASAFNQMASQLQEYYGGLEQKVKERTVEVEEARKKLEMLNLEMQKKLAELERMNKLMVGRELKMAEMKKEIEELKKKVQ